MIENTRIYRSNWNRSRLFYNNTITIKSIKQKINNEEAIFNKRELKLFFYVVFQIFFPSLEILFFSLQRNWVFATNSDFLYTHKLCNSILIILDISMLCKIQNLSLKYHRVTPFCCKAVEIINLSLRQRLNSFDTFSGFVFFVKLFVFLCFLFQTFSL